jgi:outer membrane protein assembly factor BamB
VQSLSASDGSFATPAFWRNNLYYAGAFGGLKLFEFNPTNGQFSTSPSSQSSHTFSFPGATASISSRAASDGIAWVLDVSQYGIPSPSLGPAILYAYDATDLATELWDSSQAASHRDQAGDAVKFAVPTVANGKVYVSTRSEIDVYGLLPN